MIGILRLLFGYCATCWTATYWYVDEHGLTRCERCKKIVRQAPV